MKRAGIYIGWVGRENLGDEAMYQLCRERFPDVQWLSLSRLAYEPKAGQFMRRGLGNSSHLVRSIREELWHQPRLRKLAAQGMHSFVKGLGGEVGMLGGGTLINQAAYNLESYVAVRKRTRSLVPVFGTGVSAPEFWVSRPEWKDRRKEWVSVLAELPVVGVRGPHSQELLTEAGATNVVVCGDPAIVLHARYGRVPSPDRPDRPLRVAINTGDCSGNLWGTPETIRESLLALTRWLKQARHSVEFVPVCPKDVSACVELARLAGMPEAKVSRAFTSHTRFLEKAETFDLVVALKLHAAVLAAAANVPFVMLEYQPKCLDFAASLEWERFTIRTDQLNGDGLIERVRLLIEDFPAVKMELHRNGGRLCQRFEEYCQRIEPMILRKSPAAQQRIPA